MIKTDKIRKPQPVLFLHYRLSLGSFIGLGVAMMVVALCGPGAAQYLVNCCLLRGVFQKPLSCSNIFQQTKSAFRCGVLWWVLPLH